MKKFAIMTLLSTLCNGCASSTYRLMGSGELMWRTEVGFSADRTAVPDTGEIFVCGVSGGKMWCLSKDEAAEYLKAEEAKNPKQQFDL